MKILSNCKKICKGKPILVKEIERKINSNYKFVTGPFTEKIFKIINLQKNKIDILLNSNVTSINRTDKSIILKSGSNFYYKKLVLTNHIYIVIHF